MQDLKITLVQADLHWEDIEANLAMFEEKIWRIGSSTDVIILPEMFTTGFTMSSHKLAEQMYKSAQAQTPPPGGDAGPSGRAGGSQPGNGEAKKDEGVIDAEYVDVDENK